MPQMAPLSWLSLMIMFIMMLLIFNLVNYYSFPLNMKKNYKETKTIKLINWKW